MGTQLKNGRLLAGTKRNYNSEQQALHKAMAENPNLTVEILDRQLEGRHQRAVARSNGAEPTALLKSMGVTAEPVKPPTDDSQLSLF